MDYKKAGVDLKFADQIPKIINKLKKKHHSRDRCELGGFGGYYYLECFKDKKHVLVAGTDGVGTKTVMATKYNKYNSLGQDLVAMSVNDIATTGATPLFFLDYIGHNKLNKKYFKEIVKGIIKACDDAGCVLLGGETAEMNGVYKPGDFDLVGFAVGIVDKKDLITGKKIKGGDKLIGLASSGPHSNGYTLIRKILQKNPILEKKYLKKLLMPTRIYVSVIQKLMKKFKIKGIAHITGGGLVGNIPRILPKGFSYELFPENWTVPEVFRVIQEDGKVSGKEMFRVFNMGIGLVLVVAEQDEKKILTYLKRVKEETYLIGEVKKESK